ncbi:MAG: hypothetical protein KF760_12430 [Candidatus Eremiobacteraeota bacterium]|nr:hypothetical protein [Candidatus Eremiobacteraeota bacterium]MCW5871332.1 hypothetical protein [Candidatus Eremiobacteraeota bacterium]
MSTIKHNHRTSQANSSKKSSSISKSSTPKARSAEKGRGKEAKSAEKKDGFSASRELSENKKSKDTKDSQKPGEEKDGKKAEEGKEKDKDSLLQKLSDLQKQLDEMKNKKPEEQPENLGGCCGKSHGSKKTEDPNQKEDPDSELTRLAVAVLQGPNAPQQQPGAKPGDKTGDKTGGLKAITSPAQAKAELSQKYQQYKTQGVPLRKETEQLVESALNSAAPTSTGTQPTDNKNNLPANKPNTNNDRARPLAKAS